MPQLSVIIPLSKERKYLKQALESILDSTFKDLEVLVVSNKTTGGKEAFLPIISEFPDSRLRFLNLEEKGYSEAINIAMTETKGDYISFVEPTDYVEKDCFERLIKAGFEKEANIVRCNFYITGENAQGVISFQNSANLFPYRTNHEEGWENIYIRTDHLILGWNHTWASLYKKSFLEGNQITFPETQEKGDQNLPFWLTCLYLSEKFYAINIHLYSIRYSHTDLEDTFTNIFSNHEKMRKNFEQLDARKYSLFKQILYIHLFSFASRYPDRMNLGFEKKEESQKELKRQFDLAIADGFKEINVPHQLTYLLTSYKPKKPINSNLLSIKKSLISLVKQWAGPFILPFFILFRFFIVTIKLIKNIRN